MKRRISRADVASAAGVAESTVSRALNDSPLISKEVIERIKKVAEELGYFPNRQAVLLASNKTMRLGLVVRTYKSFSPFSRSYFPRLLDGVLQQAEELGYSITIVLDKRFEEYKDLSKMIYAKEVDGLIFSVAPMNEDRFGKLLEKSVPFVLVNSVYPGANSINCDPYKGTRDAFSHIKSLGHRHIGYISGDLRFWDGTERLKVIQQLAEEYDLRLTIQQGDFSKRSGLSGARELLTGSDRPSVIFTASDRCALGVMEYCRSEAISIPESLSIVGFDNLGPARDSIPGLSTIHNPVVRMGSEAVTIIDQELRGARSASSNILMDSGFIIRYTTGIPYQ